MSLFDQGINGILADEMGLGKTVQSIAMLAHLVERENIWGPFLVVAPSSTLHNWEQELRKFVPALKVRVSQTASSSPCDVGVLVTNHLEPRVCLCGHRHCCISVITHTF